jgi:hypothetical protein
LLKKLALNSISTAQLSLTVDPPKAGMTSTALMLIWYSAPGKCSVRVKYIKRKRKGLYSKISQIKIWKINV